MSRPLPRDGKRATRATLKGRDTREEEVGITVNPDGYLTILHATLTVIDEDGNRIGRLYFDGAREVRLDPGAFVWQMEARS